MESISAFPFHSVEPVCYQMDHVVIRGADRTPGPRRPPRRPPGLGRARRPGTGAGRTGEAPDETAAPPRGRHGRERHEPRGHDARRRPGPARSGPRAVRHGPHGRTGHVLARRRHVCQEMGLPDGEDAVRPSPEAETRGPVEDAKEKLRRVGVLDRHLVGLAFSGGGIRSATFNIGVLQALADLKLLRRVDYLSHRLRRRVRGGLVRRLAEAGGGPYLRRGTALAEPGPPAEPRPRRRRPRSDRRRGARTAPPPPRLQRLPRPVDAGCSQPTRGRSWRSTCGTR